MKLKQYLEQLSPSTLKKIIEEHGMKTDISSPNELVAMIANQLLVLDNLPNVYVLLTMEEKEVLNYFILSNPNQLVTFRKLEKIGGRLTRDQFDYGISKLRRKGILFALRKSWGEVAYVIPDSLFQVWHQYFFQEIIKKQQGYAIYTFIEREEAIASIEEDLFNLLAYIYQTEVPITQKGSIHKRHIIRMNDLLQINEKGVAQLPIKPLEGNKEYPKKISLLLQFAFSLDLLNRIDYLTTTNKAVHWHKLDNIEKKEYIEGFLRQHIQSTDILIQHLFYFIFHLEEARWYSLENIAIEIGNKLSRPVAYELLTRATNEIFKPFMAFGWMELGWDSGDRLFFKWKRKGAESISQIYVQPNYEILVSTYFPHHLRIKLELFANLIQRDQMNKYMLTKESIIKGLEKGLKIQEIISFLEQYSAIPVTDNLKQTLMDWASNYGTIRFMDIRVMECKSAEIAKELKQQPLLADWIIGELSPTHLIIKKDAFEGLMEKLYQVGYIPKKEIWSERFDGNNEEYDEGDELFEVFRSKEYRVENAFPPLPNRID